MRDDELEDFFAKSNNEGKEELFAEEDDSSTKSSPQVSNNFNNNPILHDKINNLVKNKLPVSNLENITNKINSNINTMQTNITNEEQEEINSVKKNTNGVLGLGNNLLKAKTIASQEADDTLKKELTDIVLKKILTKKIIIVMGISLLVILLLIIFVLIATTVKDDESEINTSNEVIGVITGEMTYEEITDYLVYMGICRHLTNESEEKKECMESGFGKFILEFKNVYEGYQQYLDKDENPIELDVPLIMETISYNRSDNDLVALLSTNSGLDKVKNELYELAEAQVEHIQEYGDYYYYSNGQCYLKKDQLIGKPYYRISDDKYISYLKYGKVHENYSNKVRMYDAVIHPESTDKCIPEDMGYSPPSTMRYVGKEVTEEIIDNDTSNNENNNVEGSGIGTEIANYALQFVGNPYVWGGTSLTNGADCSGFTMKIFEHFGVTLPHYSLDQANYGKDIGTDVSNAIPGDLIVYKHKHVAIYIGNNKIVHAASAKTGIKVSTKADYKSILSIRRLVE